MACDTIAPTIVCLYGTNDTIVVQFSEVTTNIHDFPINFVIQERGTANFLSISSATYTTGPKTGDTVILVIDPHTPRNHDAA